MTQEEKDFFISYHKADHEWAEWIAYTLEAEGYSCIFKAWDFLPGFNTVWETQKALSQAKRTLIILSPDYLRDYDMHQAEWMATFLQDPTGEKGLLIPIYVGECILSGLLAPRISINLVGLLKDDARAKLLAGVKGTRLKPSQSPKFLANVPHFPGSNKAINNNSPGITRHTALQHNGKHFNRIAWSSDGRRFASASRDEIIQLWNIDTKEMTHILRGKLNLSIAWAPDGIQRVSGGRDSLYIWNTNTGEHRTLSTPGKLNKSVTWSPDGRILASGSTDHIILWNSKTGQLLHEFTGHSKSINCVTWSPDGRTLASGSDDRTIRLWNPATKQLIETFAEHADNVNSIAWSPDGQKLASASSDNTICIWDFEERKLQNILKGHTEAIICIAFSHDGRLLASKSLDGTVRLWRSDTGELIETINETAYGWDASLAFHPYEPRLATLGEEDTIIQIWDLQIDTLFNNIYNNSTAHYKSAKIVLVGDKGAGKTSLSLVLRNQPYVPPESTHGRYVWSLENREEKLSGGFTETREILLWDLAGQVHYRLIHQMYLNEANLALIVFNTHNDTDPFLGVRYWERALKTTQDTQSPTQNPLYPPMKRFLVATHKDLGEKRSNSKYIQKIMDKSNIDRYFETSAKSNIGITELRDAIKVTIDWDALPNVTSIELFQRIKRFIAELKEKGEEQLFTLDSMRQKFLSSQFNIIDDDQLKAQFETCIVDMDVQGLVKKFQFGPFVLLKPELLDYYASSLINYVLNNESEGFGSITEEKVLDGEFDILPDQRLKYEGLEKILLVEMVSYLLRHEIVLREYADDGSHLVFPSLVTYEPSNLVDIGEKAAVFRFEGPVHNIYTRLLVKLSHSNFFVRKDVGKNIATFTYSYNDSRQKSGVCGIVLQDIGEGTGKITLCFDKDASIEFRILFEQYVYLLVQIVMKPFQKVWFNTDENEAIL